MSRVSKSKLESLVKRIEGGEVNLYTDYYVECAEILLRALRGNPNV